MAYNAILNFEGQDFDVMRCEFSIEREYDSKGRPSSNLCGGKVTIQIESTDDVTIFKHIVTQFKSNTGTITFRKDEVDIMKEIKWINGYIIDFEEGLKNAGEIPMSICFTVSAQSLIVGGVELEQNWPEES